jgi:hypothetical protein
MLLHDFEGDIFDTRTAIDLCNPDDAHRAFKAAGDTLDHAKMAISGHPDLAWNAPDVDDVLNAKSECKAA